MPDRSIDPMLSPYTTTITNEACCRGITVRVIDASVPVFELSYGANSIRCYRSLTDRVGAVTFHLMQNKYLAGRFLREHGFPVPPQQLYVDLDQAGDFLKQNGCVVVKPCSQWGARGVSTNITTPEDLKSAVKNARRYEADILIEKMVAGDDYRLVFINYHFVCALQRRPACVTGNGRDTLRKIITAQNRRCIKIDPVHRIPLDRETARYLQLQNVSLNSIPESGQQLIVRQTANYHTGGSVHDVTDMVSPEMIKLGSQIVKAAQLSVAGIDFVHSADKQQTHVIELAPDLAISPRGGQRIAKQLIDYLFPETITNAAAEKQ